MDYRPPPDLLVGTHAFPGPYQFKAIGSVSGGFQARVLAALEAELGAEAAVDYSVRETPGGRHVALTLNVNVQDAEQVRSIYARIRAVDGLLLLL